MSNRYGPEARQSVNEALSDFKHHHKFKSRKQAIAVGLQEARKHGAKVPDKENS